MKTTLIVIEGSDGSGKATQTRLLFDRLLQQSARSVRKISFPDYNSASSALIKMYLRGEFGTHPSDVNPYAASTFYAVDRYASFRADWKQSYDAGDIIIADRYVTSNMVHQAVKIDDPTERQAFLNWLDDFEYDKLQLPRPDAVIFLDMPPEITERLIDARNKPDIHELDREYLRKCHAAYVELAARYGWTIIDCAVEGAPRGIDDIHDDIFRAVSKRLG